MAAPVDAPAAADVMRCSPRALAPRSAPAPLLLSCHAAHTEHVFTILLLLLRPAYILIPAHHRAVLYLFILLHAPAPAPAPVWHPHNPRTCPFASTAYAPPLPRLAPSHSCISPHPLAYFPCSSPHTCIGLILVSITTRFWLCWPWLLFRSPSSFEFACFLSFTLFGFRLPGCA